MQMENLGAACLSLGRLSAAAERSPLYPLWVSHETALSVSKLFSRGAAPIEPGELLALAAGLPTGGKRVEEAAARRFWAQARRLWSGRVTAHPAQNVLEITNELRGLSEAGLPPGDLALEAPLRLAQATCLPLPMAAGVLPPQGSREWEARLISNLHKEGDLAYARLEQLEHDFARWSEAVPETRGDSRLADVLVLLGTTYTLSPRYVAETLGITRQAAARLLRRLEAAGVIRQAAQRQRWLIYLAQNVDRRDVRENTSPRTSSAAGSAMLDTAALDRTLKQAYSALDQAIRRDRRGDES